MDAKKLEALIMLALGKAKPAVSDNEAIAIGELLVQEILATLPPPAPPPAS